MPIYQAVILGIVQGLAEFLPISSSAHLALIPWVFHWVDPGLAFDVALHWGTLAAVLLVFWQDWIRLFAAGLFGKGERRDFRLFWALVLSAVPGAIFGKLLDHWAEEHLRAPLLIAAMLAVLGILLWLADRAGRKSRDLGEMTYGRALGIGAAQALALIPGVSRSGATITLGLFLDFNREEIARFSFLMSTPIIFGAGLVKLPGMLREMHGGHGPVTWAALGAGFLASTVVGVAVIRWMLEWLRTRTYVVFAAYRVALAAAIVVLWLSGKR
jgi:undecaprenyl-diphosphatase